MNIFTTESIAPKWQVNQQDLIKIGKSTLIFFAAPILMYLAQLVASLSETHVLLLKDFIPNLATLGTIEGWAIGIAINFFLKLRDGQ